MYPTGVSENVREKPFRSWLWEAVFDVHLMDHKQAMIE